MSTRGGARGGRGGWRGRGRGGAQGGPVARDDEGNVLAVEQAGPPQLYPEKASLPPTPTITSKEERLLTRRHMLLDYYRSKGSPYHLTGGEATPGGPEDEIRKYNRMDSTAQESIRPKLAEVLFLDPTYFPPELYSSKQQRQSTKAQTAEAQSAFFKAQMSSKGISSLDRLAKMEMKMDKQGDGKADGATATDQADDEDEPAEDMEDEEYDEDDDYLQGEFYDDDEGYDDPYDDGDNEAFF